MHNYHKNLLFLKLIPRWYNEYIDCWIIYTVFTARCLHDSRICQLAELLRNRNALSLSSGMYPLHILSSLSCLISICPFCREIFLGTEVALLYTIKNFAFRLKMSEKSPSTEVLLESVTLNRLVYFRYLQTVLKHTTEDNKINRMLSDCIGRTNLQVRFMSRKKLQKKYKEFSSSFEIHSSHLLSASLYCLTC